MDVVETETPGAMRAVAAGMGAGAAGTTVLNLVTYADMVTRGRSSSSAPAQLVSRMTDMLGIPLGKEQTRDARTQGMGALLGIGSGLAAGVAGSLWARRSHPNVVVLAAVLGAGAMLASDVPLVAAGVTDPRQWGLSGWLADVVPHAAYGVTTAAALHR